MGIGIGIQIDSMPNSTATVCMCMVCMLFVCVHVFYAHASCRYALMCMVVVIRILIAPSCVLCVCLCSACISLVCLRDGGLLLFCCDVSDTMCRACFGKMLRRPRIELGSGPWQGPMLPLYHRRLLIPPALSSLYFPPYTEGNNHGRGYSSLRISQLKISNSYFS